MDVNDTVELAVKGTVFGQQHIHTLHFRCIEPLASQDDLLDEYVLSCLGPYRGIFTAASNPAEILSVRHVCGGIPLEATVERVPAAVVGTRVVSGDAAPSFIAQLVNERTNLAGKTRQGRFFIGGMMEADMAGNNIASGANTHFTVVTTYLDALRAAYITPATPPNGFKLVVHSRKLASVPGTECQASSTYVADFRRSMIITTQRSRKVGSGI